MPTILDQLNAIDFSKYTAEIAVGNTLTDTAATQFSRFASAASLAYAANAEGATIMAPSRGMMVPVNHVTQKAEPKFTIKTNETSDGTLARQFLADSAFAAATLNNLQTAIASPTAGAAFDFDTGSDGIAIKKGTRMKIRTSAGAHVTHLTAVTYAGTESAYGAAADGTALAENIDVITDLERGEVIFLRDIDDDVITPTITAPAITATDETYRKGVKGLQVGTLRRYCEFHLYNSATQIEDITIKATCGIIPTSGFTADASAETETETEFVVISGFQLFKR